MRFFRIVRAACMVLGAAPALAGSDMGAGQPEDSTIREKLNFAQRMPPKAACDAIEKLLEADAPEADRQACLRELSKRYAAAATATPASPEEASVIDELRRRSQPVSEIILGRFAIVLTTQDFARDARESNLLVWIDLAYAVMRHLFAHDPVAAAGRRLIVFPDRDIAAGWHFDATNFSVAVGRDAANYGTWRHAFARELTEAFVDRHPARHHFQNGFRAGWLEFGPAFIAERLSFFEGPFREKFETDRKVFAGSAQGDYLDTRLPIEEIPGASAVPGLLMRLALLDAPDPQTPNWRPFLRLFREAQRALPSGMPEFLWPARMSRDIQRAFVADRVRATLADFRFPLDAFTTSELERWEMRADATKPGARADAGKPAEAEVVLRGWKWLGPIADRKKRELDLDPLDAPNFQAPASIEFGGATHEWKADVALDDSGRIHVASGDAPAVVYLATTWPESLAKPTSIYVSSSEPVAVWVAGVMVHRSRERPSAAAEGTTRVFLPKIAPGSPVLVHAATSGKPLGLSVRAGGPTPFEYAHRVEVRSPDVSRRLAATSYLGSRRGAVQPVIDLLTVALGDNDRVVRAAAARALGGRRNEPRVIEALIERWDTDKDSLVTSAIRAALEELTFVTTESSAAAHKWWRGDDAKRWKQSCFVECESAPAWGTLVGGRVSGSPAAFGNACVGVGFGQKIDHVLGVVLEARTAAPYVLRLRYTCARDGGQIAVGVRRGEETVFLREAIELAQTRDWQTWAWIDVPIGEMRPGRYRVEVLLPNGRVDCDVVGWVVRSESEK